MRAQTDAAQAQAKIGLDAEKAAASHALQSDNQDLREASSSSTNSASTKPNSKCFSAQMTSVGSHLPRADSAADARSGGQV